MLISVIIPAYNAAATLGEALDSVRAREGIDLEILLVDDHSTDSTRQVAESWARSSTAVPVRILATPHNGGPALARNVGMRAASGEWIAFLDADDVWLPDRLANQFGAIATWRREHPGDAPVFVCGGTLAFGEADDGGRKSEVGSEAGQLDLGDFAVANPVATSTVLVRKDTIMAAGGFDEQFRGPEDYDLWIRIAGQVARKRVAGCRLPVAGEDGELRAAEISNVMLRLPTPLSRYRARPGSLSLDAQRFLPQVLRVIEKAYAPGGALAGCRAKRKARAHQFLAAAWSSAEDRRPVTAVRLLGRAFVEWPFSLDPRRRLPWGHLRVAGYVLRAWLKTGKRRKTES